MNLNLLLPLQDAVSSCPLRGKPALKTRCFLSLSLRHKQAWGSLFSFSPRTYNTEIFVKVVYLLFFALIFAANLFSLLLSKIFTVFQTLFGSCWFGYCPILNMPDVLRLLLSWWRNSEWKLFAAPVCRVLVQTDGRSIQMSCWCSGGKGVLNEAQRIQVKLQELMQLIHNECN